MTAENGAPLLHRARNRFWMAPMSGITDVCFRQLMDEMGAGVIVSELVSARGLLHGSARTRSMIDVHPDAGALMGTQLFGDDADGIIAASRCVEATPARFLDINLGCPAAKVVKKGSGSALLRDPARLEAFLAKIKRNVRLPLTVKMRTGWDQHEITVHECVEAAAQAGCEWVVIHGRTRAQGYEGHADWELIAAAKARARIPIIGNGDLRSAGQARHLLQTTGVDAVMIGRGALRNPWIFQECSGALPPEHIPGRLRLIERYLALLEQGQAKRHAMIHLRKFLVWMAYGHHGASLFRRQLFTFNTIPDIMRAAADFFAAIAHLPVPDFADAESFLMGGHG